MMSLDLQSPEAKGKDWPDHMRNTNLETGLVTGGSSDAAAFTSSTVQTHGVQHLKVRSDIHIARRLWHFFGVMAIVAIFNSVTRQTSLTLLLLAIITLVPLDL